MKKFALPLIAAVALVSGCSTTSVAPIALNHYGNALNGHMCQTASGYNFQNDQRAEFLRQVQPGTWISRVQYHIGQPDAVRNVYVGNQQTAQVHVYRTSPCNVINGGRDIHVTAHNGVVQSVRYGNISAAGINPLQAGYTFNGVSSVGVVSRSAYQPYYY